MTARLGPQYRHYGRVQGELTLRQLDVLRLSAEGLPYDEIAEELCISRVTVNRHLSVAFLKLGVRNRVHAVATALRQGLIE